MNRNASFMLKKLSISLLLGATVLSLRAQSSTKKSASPQLSRSFTESFASPVDGADHFLVSIVKDVIPAVGVTFRPSTEDLYNFETEGIALLPADSSTFTYTEPGVYVIVPLKDGEPLCFGSYVVMNEDYLGYFLDEDSLFYRTEITEDNILCFGYHTVGDPSMPILSQALWYK